MLAIIRLITGKCTAWAVLLGTVIAVGLLFALLPANASEDFPAAGLPAYVTGPVGFQADISNAFAGADFRLLLVARYREELLHTENRNVAMRTAVTSAGPAIAASGGTVALSLATLVFAELAGNRALGIACAIGVLIAILFALLVLPAALVVCGRGLFWPFIPRAAAESAPVRTGFWTRLGRGVARHPAIVTVVSVLAIGSLAFGLNGAAVGLSQADQLLGTPESVVAQEIVDASFSAGLTSQTVVLAPDAASADAVAAAAETTGVSSAVAGELLLIATVLGTFFASLGA